MLIINFSRLSSAPALLLNATAADITKLSFTLTVLLPIKLLSIIGESYTITQAGAITDSGTEE
jgi:hypothetical protein